MDALLAPDEGPAVEIREGGGAFVVVCEHASNRVPRALGTLGLDPADLERHIAWDPGAADLAERVAGRLDADLVRQRFSRLVADCNRDPALADAVTTISEATEISGNRDLTPEARAARFAAVWMPFHDAIDALLDRRAAAGRATTLVTIHSFTPVYAGVARPWHVGIISTDERGMAEAMLAVLRRDSGLTVGDNEPYSAKDHVDFTIRRHGRERGLPHVMIEVRNDLLRDADGIAAWSERLTAAIAESAAALRSAPAESGR